MKKLLLTLLSTALAGLLLTGCVQMHMVSEIDKNGGGTASLKVSLSQVVTESMEEIAAMDEEQDMDLGAMTTLTRKELEKKVKGHGVKVKEFENGLVDGKQTLNVVFEFKDLEGFSFAMGEVMGGEGTGDGMAIFENGDGNFVLRSHAYDWPVDEDKAILIEEGDKSADAAEEMDPEKMQKQMELMGKLMGAMAEMDISMKITVPGDVVESNAPVVEGRTSIWTINAGNMMQNQGDLEPVIVFSGKGLKLKALE